MSKQCFTLNRNLTRRESQRHRMGLTCLGLKGFKGVLFQIRYPDCSCHPHPRLTSASARPHCNSGGWGVGLSFVQWALGLQSNRERGEEKEGPRERELGILVLQSLPPSLCQSRRWRPLRGCALTGTQPQTCCLPIFTTAVNDSASTSCSAKNLGVILESFPLPTPFIPPIKFCHLTSKIYPRDFLGVRGNTLTETIHPGQATQ